jgi:hypothetical protein
MNTKILEAIGQFVDANYLSEFKIEGYFGFAYLTVGDHKWHFFIDQEGELQSEKLEDK